jgi:WD40 repeat protein
MKKYVVLIACLSIWMVSVHAQNLIILTWPQAEKDSFRTGKSYYDAAMYDLAAPIFINLQKKHPKEVYLQYAAGVCALERSDLCALALDLLQQASDNKVTLDEAPYNLARAQLLNYKFDEALTTLTKMEAAKKGIPKDLKEKIDLLKIYCNNAKTYIANPVAAKIENLGNPPNTAASEYVPVVSADEETMVYTYAGDSSIGGLRKKTDDELTYARYFEDVYITKKVKGVWSPGRNIGVTINTAENDAAVSISPDGHMLFTYRDDGSNGGDLYVSYLQGNEWGFPSPLTGDINRGDTWEGSCSISADGKTLYFASNRKGGFGGRDLYTATQMSDGSWGKVKNMGPKINTKYDEDAPFIHPDGRLLIYNSTGEKSMGNYDIFKTIYNPADTSWSEPENMGYPINTPDRDSYYVLSASGERGYYSSGKAGGQGLQDIYIVTPGILNYKPVLLVVKGLVTAKGQPAEANIVVSTASDAEIFSLAASNSVDGKYLVSLKEGDNYKLIFSLKGHPDKIFDVKGKDMQGYTEEIINVDFSDTILVASTPAPDSTVKKTTQPIKEQSAEGLYFRIQIAAYEHPQNYDAPPKLLELGKVERLELADGIYRITLGGDFNTFAAAEEFLKTVRKAGQADGFITAVYQGKRVYLDDLTKQGVLKK